MVENWKPIEGFVGLYEVSDQGRVKSLGFMQRYLLRNGKEAFRRTKEKILKAHTINSGYLLTGLWRADRATGCLVHRLVAAAFIPNPDNLPEVNHKDGNKMNCSVGNLEWVTRRRNKEHAVEIGLNVQAQPVRDPRTGRVYPSISRAAKVARKAHRTVRATFTKGDLCLPA